MRITEACFSFFGGLQKVRILPKSRRTIIIGHNGSGKTTLLKTLYTYFKGDHILQEEEAVKTDLEFSRLAFVWAAVGEQIGDDTIKAPILGNHNDHFDTHDILKKVISEFDLDPNKLKKSKAGGHLRLYAMLEAAAKISPDGILLVDELGRHLQIETQYLLVKALTSILPEGHLIGTTHSPCVLSNRDDDEIITL